MLVNGTVALDHFKFSEVSSSRPYDFKSDLQPSIKRADIISTDTDFFQRYQGIDLKYFSSIMTPSDLNIFMKFIGRNNVEIIDNDFDNYYPEDE